MTLGGGVGSDSVKLLIAGAEELLGRPLEDAEKALVVQLKGVIDYAAEKLTGILAGKRIVISVEDKPL